VLQRLGPPLERWPGWVVVPTQALGGARPAQAL